MRATVSLIVRRWRTSMLVVLLVQLTALIATVVTAAVPIYSETVERATLSAALDDAPAIRRSVEVSARVGAIATGATIEALRSGASDSLPDGVAATFVRTDQFRLADDTAVELGTVIGEDELYESVEVVEPLAGAAVPVGLHVDAAEAIGVRLGDVLEAERSGTGIELEVTRLVAPRSTADARWLDDVLARDGVATTGEFTTFGLFLLELDRLETLGGSVQVDHRVAMRADDLDVDDLAAVASAAGRISSAVEPAVRRGADGAVVTQRGELDQQLASIDARLRAGGPIVSILLFQVVMVALVATGLAASILARSRDREVRLQRLRGASPRRIVATSTLEAAALIAPTVVVAPFLAVGVVDVVDRLGPFRAAGLQLDASVSSASLLAASVVGLVAIVLVVLPAATAGRVDRSRRSAGAALLDSGLDVVIGVTALLSIWRLTSIERSAAATEGLFDVDPLEVLAPALGVLVAVMVVLRLVRFIGGTLDRSTRAGGGPAVRLASATLRRRPIAVIRVATVVVFAVSVGVLSVVLGRTWERSQIDRADAAVSTDVFVEFDTAGALDPRFRLAAVRATPGVDDAVPVSRSRGSLASGGESIEVVAVATRDADSLLRLRDDLWGSAPPVDELVGAPFVDGSNIDAVETGAGASFAVSVEVTGISGEFDAPITLFAYVRDGDGTVHRMETEPVPVEIGMSERTFALHAAANEDWVLRGPVTLVSLDVEVPIAFLSQFDATTADVLPDGWSVELALAPASGLAREAFDGWTVVFPAPTASTVQAPAVTSAARGASVALTVDSGLASARRSRLALAVRPAALDADPSVAGYVTEPLARRLGLAVGSTAPIRVDGFVFDLAVVGLVEAVPFAVETDAALLVDWATLQDRRFAMDGIGRPPGGAAASASRADATDVVDVLRTGPFASSTAVDRWTERRANADDPVAISLVGALSIAAIAAFAVALVVLALSAVAAARERRHDAAALRAIGLRRRTIRRAVLIEMVPAIAVAAMVSVVTAVVLARVLIDEVTIGIDGDDPVPAPVVAVPIVETSLVVLAVTSFAVLCPLAVSGALRRVRAAEELRAGAPT